MISTYFDNVSGLWAFHAEELDGSFAAISEPVFSTRNDAQAAGEAMMDYSPGSDILEAARNAGAEQMLEAVQETFDEKYAATIRSLVDADVLDNGLEVELCKLMDWLTPPRKSAPSVGARAMGIETIHRHQ